MTEIKLNKSAFDSKIGAIKSEYKSLASVKIRQLKLNKTNLRRFKDYCRASKKLTEQLKRYEALLSKDIHKIQAIGIEIERKDKELGHQLASNSNGVEKSNGQLEMR
ncbi:type VII secretion effector [Listeria grayi]|uniref:Type VII secretion effector n=1 Tax=Listeria grayi TaxID=1641 RepID=A0A378MEZ1_LISGR|nr:TIGR04197 family type VII secretion effector [Listeria grayi]STY44851.1 type VII secretion effector [Listeria grayi]